MRHEEKEKWRWGRRWWTEKHRGKKQEQQLKRKEHEDNPKCLLERLQQKEKNWQEKVKVKVKVKVKNAKKEKWKEKETRKHPVHSQEPSRLSPLESGGGGGSSSRRRSGRRRNR